MKKSLIYLVCGQNCSRTRLRGFNWNLIFTYSMIKMPGKSTVLLMDFISFHCAIAGRKHLIFVNHKDESLSP